MSVYFVLAEDDVLCLPRCLRFANQRKQSRSAMAVSNALDHTDVDVVPNANKVVVAFIVQELALLMIPMTESVVIITEPCRESDILQDLPPRLHAEVKAFSNADICSLLKNMPLFQGFDDNIVSKLIVALRTMFFPPAEVVCVEGEVGRHTYLIRKGTVNV